MAFSRHGSAGADGGAFDIACTLDGAVAAGDVGLCFVSWSHDARWSVPQSVTDTSSNTWTLVSGVGGIGNPGVDGPNGQDCTLYICNNMAAAASAPTITANIGGSFSASARRIIVLTYSGRHNVSPISGTPVATLNASSTTANSANITPADNNCDIVSFCQATGAVSIPSAGTSYTRRDVTVTVPASGEAGGEDFAQTTAAAIPGRWTMSASTATVVFTVALKPAGAPTGYTASPADPVGITDARALDRGLTKNDPVGLTDSVVSVKGPVANPNEPVGITDAITLVRSINITVADGVGVTDTGAPQVLDIGLQVDDPVGLTDTATPVLTGGNAFSRTIADAVGLSDSTALVFGLGRVVAESVGITDSVSISLITPGNFVANKADNLTLTDSVLAILDVPGAGMTARRWNGTTWAAAPMKRWNGSAWVSLVFRQWDGDEWVE